MTPNEISHWSFSSLKQLSNCPRSWYVQYVKKEKQPAGSAAAFGSAFDQGVCKRLGIAVEKESEQIVLSEEDENSLNDAVSFYELQPQTAFWRGAKGQVKIEITPEEWAEYADIYGTESRLAVPIIGYIDMLQQNGPTVEVCDLKTSGRAEFRSEWPLQLLLYSLAKRASVCHVHLLTRLKKGFGFQAYRFRPTKQSYAWMINTLGWLADQGERARMAESEEQLPSNSGWWCSYCPRNIECEANRLQSVEVY